MYKHSPMNTSVSSTSSCPPVIQKRGKITFKYEYKCGRSCFWPGSISVFFSWDAPPFVVVSLGCTLCLQL
ncbi:hypothetical protein XENTR_v10012035 [Xenopus tropicalis]|nr:hypothetical protein XENTR_v10012035 [Xenopus tropicalis]